MLDPKGGDKMSSRLNKDGLAKPAATGRLSVDGLPIELVRRGPVPSARDCPHVKYYCEENVWKLCEQVTTNRPEELTSCYAVFVSNKNRAVPIWQQKLQKSEEPVVWDYHVIFLWANGPRSYVYDLDSCLPFPCKFEMYLKEAIRADTLLQPEYYRQFRVVDATTYLQKFASNRKHMLDESGQWKSKPPPYPCIKTEESDDNIQDFISMEPTLGFGHVLNLEDFTHRFSQPLTS